MLGGLFVALAKGKSFPQGLKADDFAGFMYGLKPLPFTNRGFIISLRIYP
jgi:hypothetical protein